MKIGNTKTGGRYCFGHNMEIIGVEGRNRQIYKRASGLKKKSVSPQEDMERLRK